MPSNPGLLTAPNQAVSHMASFPLRFLEPRAPGVFELRKISQRQSVQGSAQAARGGFIRADYWRSRPRRPPPREARVPPVCSGGGRPWTSPGQLRASRRSQLHSLREIPTPCCFFGWSQATSRQGDRVPADHGCGVGFLGGRAAAAPNCGPTNDVAPLSPPAARVFELGCTERYTACR